MTYTEPWTFSCPVGSDLFSRLTDLESAIYSYLYSSFCVWALCSDFFVFLFQTCATNTQHFTQLGDVAAAAK